MSSEPSGPETPGPEVAHSLGIASLVLGVASFLAALLPYVGAVAVPLAIVAVALGLAGGWLSLRHRGAGIGYLVGGIAAGLLAVVIGTIGVDAFAKFRSHNHSDKWGTFGGSENRLK